MLSILQSRLCVKKIVFALYVLGLAGCQMAEDAVDSGIGLARDCGVDNLEDVASLRTISDDCKMALLELLPDFEDNLSGALVPLGSETFEGKPVVFFAAANAEGLPLTLDEAEQLKVTAISEDAETVLDASQYVLKKLSDFPGRTIAVSAIVDYSGSMSNGDLADAAEIYQDLFSALQLTSMFEANVLFFSDSVSEIQPFTDDAAVIKQALEVNTDYERGYTALYDAVGTGLTGLAARDVPIRLLVLATDGLENASETYTRKNELYTIAREQRIPVIILGALFADLRFLRQMADETNGIFMYSRMFLHMKSDFARLRQTLAESIALELQEQKEEWERIRIEAGGESMEWPL